MSVETFTEVQGRDVVASDNAESIGSVKGFVLDASGRRIEAIHIAGRARKATIVDWSAVEAFGADAVMTRSSGASSVEDDHQRSAVRGAVTMLGARVLTVDGDAVGTVTDAEFDTGTGSVVCVITDQGPIDSGRLRALGSYALVVDPSAPEA